MSHAISIVNASGQRMVRFLILCSVKIHLDTVQECHFNSISFPHYFKLCVVLNATFIGGAIAKGRKNWAWTGGTNSRPKHRFIGSTLLNPASGLRKKKRACGILLALVGGDAGLAQTFGHWQIRTVDRVVTRT